MSHLLVNPIKALWIGGDYARRTEVEIVGFDYLNYPIIRCIGGLMEVSVTYSELLVF